MSYTGANPSRTSVDGRAGPADGVAALLWKLGREALAAQLAAVHWALLAVALAALLLGAAFYVTLVTGKPFDVLISDPNGIAKQPNYFGALEYAGIILMSGAGWISLFSATLCRGQARRFLLLGGLLSLMLAADDLYMLHENSWRFHLNERILFSFYGMLLVLLVVTNVRQFLKTPFVLLGMALLFLAGAIVFDLLQHFWGKPMGLFEESPEIVGICFWSVYFAKSSRDALLARSSPS